MSVFGHRPCLLNVATIFDDAVSSQQNIMLKSSKKGNLEDCSEKDWGCNSDMGTDASAFDCAVCSSDRYIDLILKNSQIRYGLSFSGRKANVNSA